jgi:hypothetical protein
MEGQMTIKEQILEAAKRRTIYASTEAQMLNVPLDEARSAIRSLKNAKLIYISSEPKRNYWGSSESGYRAN